MQNLFKSLFFALALTLVVFLTLPVQRAAAQATTGQIVGQVTDPTGAVIPGAAILATDEEKGVTFKGTANSAGIFSILSMPPGIYTIQASANGFASSKLSHAVLEIDQHLNLNFKLKIGSVSATVEVTEAAPMLQTQSSEVGTVISGDVIQDLPLLGRQFFDLTYLVPGVMTGNGSNMNSFNLSVSGQREYANSVQLDGIETTSNRTQDITITPNVDSVAEFKVETATYNAEFGNAAGGVVTVQTKAGTNSFHGDAFEFFRPPFMAARQTLPGVSATQPESTLRQHNFGGTIGGPIKKNKAFFFVAYEGMINYDTWNYITATIPTSMFTVEDNGDVDFSHIVDPHAGLPNGPPAGTIDPINDPDVAVAAGGWWAAQFPGNIIPASRVSTAGMNTIKNFFPEPNLPGTYGGWFRNYQAHQPENKSNHQIDARYDQVINDKNRLYSVFHWSKFNYLTGDTWNDTTPVKGAGDLDQATNEDQGASSLSVTYDHSFSPTALNEVRVGYLELGQNQYSLLNGTDYSTKFGFGNVAIPGYEATIGFPAIFMADGYLAGGSSWKPYHSLDQNYQFSDSYTWTRIARHEFKFGGDLRLLNSHPNFSLFPTGWQYYGSYGNAETSAQAFWGYYTCAYFPDSCVTNGYNWLGGSDIADLVLGLPLDNYMGLQLTKPHTMSHNLDFFAQDTFKVTPKLTINYGIRYEYSAPWTEENNDMSNYDLKSGNIIIANRNGVSSGIIKSRNNNFSPRLGFAYAATPKTVFRAGFAILYSPENDGREDYLTKNNPFALQYSFTNWEFSVPESSNGPVWGYQDDLGIVRDTAINIPASGFIDPQNLVNGTLENTFSVNPSMKTGTTGSYNLSVQSQLTKTLVLDISYVGSTSRHLSYSIGDINADPNKAQGSNSYDGLITPYLGQIQYLSDPGLSKYNSLQVKLTRQLSRNTSFLLSYTWGHSLDNGPAPFDLGNNNDRPQNPYNLKAEYGNSDDDVRQNLVFSGDYKLPFGKGQHFLSNSNMIVDGILGGWKLGTIVTLNTGTPVNVILGDDPKSALAGLRPNVTGNPNLPRGQRTILNYFNKAAFSAPLIPPGNSYAYGNAGRDILQGPAYNNIDAVLSKEFVFEHNLRMQIRAEAFNATNSVHLWNPDADFQDGAFGTILGAGAARVGQLAVKILF